MIQVQSCFCTDKDMSWDCGLTSRPFDQNKSEKDGEFTSNGQGWFQMNNSTFLESEREIKQDAYLLASFVEGWNPIGTGHDESLVLANMH